ncbi:SEC14 [Nesidiocoris tenuis]|uniref:SEC14 n=1 Tax=Nesidiocoris tenuis TaxID=355587 RepID=A0ABN7ARA4_9HEMI|nr:SEC14 [Nesidiocoris tenuis]
MGAIKENPLHRAKAAQKLHEKFGITADGLAQDIEHLKNWMAKQPHFPNTDHLNLDLWLENQIIIAKNSLERAKLNIDRYFTARTFVPDVFEGRDMLSDGIRQTFDNVTISYLPGLTSKLLRVSIFRIESPDAEHFHFDNIIKRCLMAMEYFLKVGFDFAGFYVVLDLQNFRLNHLSRINVSFLRSMSVAIKAYPVSFSAINILNAPTFLEKALALFKPFISAKLYNRVVLLKDIEELQSLIGDIPLPSDYSGTGISQKENSDMMKRELTDNRDYILRTDQAATIESKRLNKSISCSSFEPVLNGSFRKLCID